MIPRHYCKCPLHYREMLDDNEQEQKYRKPFLAIINCIPPYLGIDKSHLDEEMGCFSKSYRLGYAMDLSRANTAREFLRNQLGKKPYKNLRQDRQRLERDHCIQLQIYHGKIEKKDYEMLMATLKSFIRQRFKGRTHKHNALQRWDHYSNTVFKKINEGTASFFVLLENDLPTAIALNYHYKKLLHPAIISFDTSFKSYSLGKQMFHYQIEWCYYNNYKLIDTGWGNFDYKMKFSNAAYQYETHILYPKKNILLKGFALLISQLLMIKNYLESRKDSKFTKPIKQNKERWLRLPYDICGNS